MIFHRRRLLGVGRPAFVAAVGATNTWSPTDKNSHVSLSGGNLTASNPGGTTFACGRAVDSATSGKFYWEVRINSMASGDASVGTMLATDSIGDFGYPGVSGNGIGYLADNRVAQNGATLLTLTTYGAGNTICIALDIPNAKQWFRVDGGGWNNDILANQNPAANIGGFPLGATLGAGPIFAAYSLFNAAGDNLTANFGATAYSQTPPSGFSNWP